MFGIDPLVPLMSIAIVGAFFALVAIVARNYIKVPPNQVAIFYGKSRQLTEGQTVGFRVVTGGSKMRVPT
jgi:flotillin